MYLITQTSLRLLGCSYCSIDRKLHLFIIVLAVVRDICHGRQWELSMKYYIQYIVISLIDDIGSVIDAGVVCFR